MPQFQRTETDYTPIDFENAMTVAWKEGRLDYLRRNTQKLLKQKWLESKLVSRKCYWECTRRLGKSTELLMTMHEECRKAPGRKCVFFAPVKDGLLDYIEPIIEETYSDCPNHLRPQFDRHRFLLSFDNSSRILFRAANNKQYRVRRGLGAHLAGIDEAREIDNLMELIDSIIMPALFSNDGHLIISSTPADTRSHPLYQIRSRAMAEGWHVPISIYDAQRLDPYVYSEERIKEWKKETMKDPDGQARWEREFEIKWSIVQSRIAVPEWESPRYVMDFPRDPYYKFYNHYFGLDWGSKDFTALLMATHNFRKGRLEFDLEMAFSGKDVRSDLIAEKVRPAYRHLYGVDLFDRTRYPMIHTYRQVSDSADPILINEINKESGMSFVPVEKAHTLEAMLQEFRILVMRGKIVVHPRCQLLIYCLENAVWTEKRDELDDDQYARHFDHLMAAVYLSRMVDWEANPIPKDYMVDNVRVIDMNFDGSRAQGSGLSLEDAFGGRRRR